MSTVSIGDASAHSFRVGRREYGPGRGWLLQEIAELGPGTFVRAIRSDRREQRCSRGPCGRMATRERRRVVGGAARQSLPHPAPPGGCYAPPCGHKGRGYAEGAELVQGVESLMEGCPRFEGPTRRGRRTMTRLIATRNTIGWRRPLAAPGEAKPVLGALGQPAAAISTVTCVAPDVVRSVSNGAPGADVTTAPSTVTM